MASRRLDVSRIDPATNTVTPTIPLAGAAGSAVIDGLATTPGSVWVGLRRTEHDSATPPLESTGFTVVRIDIASNTVAAEIAWPSSVPPDATFALASHGTTLWIATAGSLARVDATTEVIAAVDIPQSATVSECATRCAGLVASEQVVWIVLHGASDLLRVDRAIPD
ncbi:MAG TPA: hypothetical protein VMM78_06705 [Thermomicrobiales bacterium]|nr:hypothetical protein [Thermomicrobiales bacterium]